MGQHGRDAPRDAASAPNFPIVGVGIRPEEGLRLHTADDEIRAALRDKGVIEHTHACGPVEVIRQGWGAKIAVATAPSQSPAQVRENQS